MQDAPAWHTTGEWRESKQGSEQRVAAEIALFWHDRGDAERAQKLGPRWMRALAVVVGSLMCGAFARALLTRDPSSSGGLPVQPSAATAATLHVDSQAVVTSIHR
ncbi:MAG TPA: hypothetical protein VFN67_32525 [Polyangiales bacterium]|nr:hypothetical protein [Polyangiales bacterium]